MIHHRVEQGSGEWHRLRLGIPTASQFHRIVTPVTWQFSASAREYAYQLAAEILLNEVTTSIEGIEAMERGKELEPAAVRAYEFENDFETESCGFLTTDDGRIGASPDRLLNPGGAQSGCIEIKCPAAAWKHLRYMIEGFGADYMPQVQGQILVGEFDFCDRFAYHPSMPSALVRTWRDDGKQKMLRQALADFLEVRDEILERARATGVFAERVFTATPTDLAFGEAAREGGHA